MKTVLTLLGAAFLQAQQGDQDPKKLPPSQKDPPKVYQPLSKDEEERLTKDRERFGVKPVDSEPELPTLDEAKAKGLLELPGGGYLHKDAGGSRAVIPGMIGIASGMIEVFATLGPKEHEAVLRVYTDIHVLDYTVSSVLRIKRTDEKRGDYPEKYGEADKTDDGRLLVFVQWKTKEGKTVTYRAEDLIINVKSNRTFPRVGWMYLGGWHQTENPVNKKPQRTLRAALSKLVMTTFRDPYSLIDNALKVEDATDDIYAANMFVLPDPGTSVLISFRKPTAEELAAVKQLEKRLYP